jgi:hypothetical protein
MLWFCGLHYLGGTTVAVPSSLFACRSQTSPARLEVRSARGICRREFPRCTAANHKKAFHQWGAENGSEWPKTADCTLTG